MKEFLEFFRFEIRFWLRGMMLYVFTAIIAVLIFSAAISDNVVVGASLENTQRNAPHVIQDFYAVMALLTCLMITAFVNGAASRDFHYNTYQIVFTKPIDKLGYLMGRFWGSTLIAVIPMLGVSLGIILAGFLPSNDPERWGPISWGAHLWSIVIFALPNAFFVATLIFAIAILTRSTIASFLGALLLLVGYSISRVMLGDLDHELIPQLLDPFGIQPFRQMTKYWTVEDKNTQYATLTGTLLANRILWLSVSCLILGATCWRFRFAEPKTRTRNKVRGFEEESVPQIALPAVTTRFGVWTSVQQLLSQVKVDFLTMVRSNVFVVVMLAALINMAASLILSSSERFGLQSIPVTYQVIEILRGSMYIFLLAVITFYAGVMVWKERDANLDEVYDALPHPTWIAYAGKLGALMLMLLCVLAVATVAGLTFQAARGHTQFQVGVYLQELFLIDFVQFYCLMVLAVLAHVVSPNKYVGYFAFIIVAILNTFMWGFFRVETRMVKFGDLPSYTYSDMFGIAPYIPSLWWFALYWLLFAVILSILTIVSWQRGKPFTSSRRFVSMRSRLRGGLPAFGIAAVLMWVVSGVWVYYNTRVLNEFLTSHQRKDRQAEYEKSFKELYGSLPQPRITEIKHTVDIYPDSRSLVFRGDQVLVNKEQQPIDRIVLVTDGDYETEVEIERATLDESFKDFDLYIYRIEPPMQPRESLNMSYVVRYEPKGFEDSLSNSSIVQNGTFFNNMIAPAIGYQPQVELSDKKDRKKRGLGPPARMPDLEPDNLAARSNNYLLNFSDWVDVETVISTSADQIAIAPGTLQRAWEENGRRYFHYIVDHPSVNFYSFISARYKVARSEWNGIDIEVYYHPDHEWNVGNMLRSIQKSLEYYSEHFSPYRHRQARIIEFPRVASFAQAFPGTMPYSEGVGFIAEIKDSDDIDMVFYVVAHEMAHQWWAHQVIGANMRGATLLSETLAQYSALMVMEKEFGRDIMRKFLKYEMDKYLSSRGGEMLDEQPLRTVEASQGYVHYNKGSVVMYHLKEMIGEERVNAALRSLVERFAYQEPPYPTSVDLINALRAEAPDEYQDLISDLFEQITAFENRTLTATYRPDGSGKYVVKLDVECQKSQYDGKGKRTPRDLHDWIEIGAFAEPEPGKKYGATLHRHRVLVTQPQNTYEFVVDEVPATAGIDPFRLLIDRTPDDNVIRVKEEKQ